MSRLARIAVVTGDTPAARAVAGAVGSLLTAVGRWVEVVPRDLDPDAFTAVIFPSASQWRAVRERRRGPLLVVDADLLAGRMAPEFRDVAAGASSARVSLGDTPILLPLMLPTLVGPALGDAPRDVVARAGAGLGYVLPIFVAPALRTVAGFWALAGVLDEAVAGLLEENTPLYAAPWPRGVRAARVLTYDSDGLEAGGVLPACATNGRPATLFCTADALDRLSASSRRLEVAAHGDVHRAFADPRTNLARVDRTLEAFRAAGITPQGFSPPNSTYSSELGPLFARFAYVRLGYQERGLRFYPEATDAGVLTSASYYTDFLQRYVGPEECARLLSRFCAWAEATSVLAIPCFHPCLWDEPLRRFLERPAGEVWETTLADLSGWWKRRRAALDAVARAGDAAAPAELVLARATPAERLASLRPPKVELPPRRPLGTPARVHVGGYRVRVLPAIESPATAVDMPLGPGWRSVGWLPAGLRRVVSAGLVRVTNQNGLHGCFYGDLGLVPEVTGGALRLPVVAPDEPVLVTHPGRPDLRRLLTRVVRWFSTAARRSPRSAPVDDQ